MKLSDPAFKLASTVVLAYPDDTRLGGYRTALALYNQLSKANSSSSSSHGQTSFDSTPKETIGEPVNSDSDELTTVPLALHTLAESNVSFCFVNGLPSQEHIPRLVDQLIQLLEAHQVQRLIVPAAANLSGNKESKGQLLFINPQQAQTTDVVLSVLANVAAMSAIVDVRLLVYGDKRPAGSGYRQKVVFGSEYADEDDRAVVGALGGQLAKDLGVAECMEMVEVERIRQSVDAAASVTTEFG